MARPFDVDREPWERQNGETTKVYALFTEFMRAPVVERSARAFAEARGMSASTIGSHMTRWRWADRIAAYEAEIDKQALKVAGDHNRRAAADLASVMTQIPEAAGEALRLGLRTLQEYADAEPWQDSEGKWWGRLHARDAVSLMQAANQLTTGLTRYLESAGQLNRSLNIRVEGRIEHAISNPESADLLRFIGAMREAGMLDEPEREILEAEIIEELGDIRALEAGNGSNEDSGIDDALQERGSDQSLPMEADA